MNKLFTLVFALAATLSAGAAITVTKGGEPVANGATVTFTKDDFKKALPIPSIPWEAGATFAVNSPSTVTVNLTADTEDIQFCPTGLQCYTFDKSGDLYVKTGTLATLPIDVHIAMQTRATEVPAFNNYINVALTNAANETFSFKVVFDTTGNASLGSVASDGITVAYSANTLAYTSTSPATLEVYSITGSLALSRKVAGEGTVDLSHLAAGVYIYRLGTHVARILVK